MIPKFWLSAKGKKAVDRNPNFSYSRGTEACWLARYWTSTLEVWPHTDERELVATLYPQFLSPHLLCAVFFLSKIPKTLCYFFSSMV